MPYSAQALLYVASVQQQAVYGDMAVGDKLKTLRERAGLSVRKAANLFGFKYGSGWQYWESDGGAENTHLTPELAERAFALVGLGDPPITRADVLELFPPIDPSWTGVVDVPVLSQVQAGALADAIEPHAFAGDAPHERVASAPETTIALRVQGSSMNHVAPEGSLALVDYSDRDLISGRYYVVKIGDHATFKRYRSNPDRFEPDSTESHDTIFPEKPVLVVGRVFRIQLDL